MTRRRATDDDGLAGWVGDWRRLRAGEAATRPDMLDQALLLARDGASAFRVVAAGPAARRRTGLAFGADFASVFAPACRARARRLLARAAASPQPTMARLPLARPLQEEDAYHASPDLVPAPPAFLLLPVRNGPRGEACLIAGFAQGRR
jgi:hypothetical protein